MSLKDITITGSIGSIATQSYGQRTYISSTDEQSFPIEHITGSYAGAWPNFKLKGLTTSDSASNTTVDLIVNVTQSWPASNVTTLGIIPYTHNTMEEFIDGEFSGSNYTVTNGNLNDAQCQQFLIANNKAFKYSIFPYASQFLYPFNHTNTMPGNGEVLIYFIDSPYPIENVMYAKISRIDKDGNDLTNTLSQLTVGNYIEWIDSGNGSSFLVKLEIENRTDNATYFLFKFKPNLITTPGFFDDNYLDYKFLATQSLNYVVTSSTNGTFLYFKNGTWTITTDSASGWNNSTKQYFFPLSPNTQITFTASISMSVNYPVSFSWGIQAWQLSTSEIMGGVPSTVPVWNDSNYIYLPAGAQTLVITGSTYQPIEGYAYEIDGALKGNYLFPYWSNEYLIGTGSKGDFGGNGIQYDNVPYPYKSWYSIGSNTFERDPASEAYTSFSNVNKGESPPDGYQFYNTPSGQGVYLWNSTGPSNTNRDCLLTWWTSSNNSQALNSDNIFNASDVGKTIKVSVEIPSPYPGYPGGPITNPSILNDIQNNYGGGIFGPSSGSNIRVVTTTVGSNSGGGTIATQSLIGIIPSQSSGLFEFDYTIHSGDRKIGIYAPAGASDEYDGVPLGWQFAVSRFIVSTPVSASFYDLKWSITQSNDPATSTSSFIFEPYFPSAFYDTDCDVLMNNYSENDISTMYQEVLYDNGGTVPSNLQQIISGTAQYAQVNDYLYAASANRLPRYGGVRTTSANFNLPSQNGLTNEELSVIQKPSDLVINTGTSNVQNTQTYFAYYDYIVTSSAELLNKSALHIIYLIDEQGNVLTPSLSSSYYYNLIDNFETDKNINITSNTFDTSLVGLKRILRPGAIPWGICASQTGSGNNFNNTMSFSNTNSTVLIPNYSSLVNGTNQTFPIVTGGSTTAVDFYSSVYSGAGNVTVDLAYNYFIIDTTANNVTLNVKLEGSFGLSNQNSGQPSNVVTLTVYCQESPNGTNWTNIDSKNVLVTYGISTYVNINFTSFTPIAGKYYRLVIYNGSGYFSAGLSNGKISLVQTPIPTNAGIVTSSYWYTGSNSKNILTGSQFLQLYTSYKAYQLNYADSGYKNFLEFDIRSSDEIRFEGDESQVYSIYNVTSDNTSLYLELSKNIVDGTNLNSFLIRRYEPHPNFITVDWDIDNIGDTTTVAGYAFPEYISNAIKQNLPSIIENLTNKSLI